MPLGDSAPAVAAPISKSTDDGQAPVADEDAAEAGTPADEDLQNAEAPSETGQTSPPNGELLAPPAAETPIVPLGVGEPTLMVPDNSAPTATGPLPTITSSMVPAGAQPGVTPRTVTVTYKNDGAAPIVNGRFWEQLMSRVDNTTAFSVTCSASGGAVCPSGFPITTQTQALSDHEYLTAFAFIANLPVGAQFTFVISMTVTPLACADSTSVMSGAWARFGQAGFDMPGNIDASASSVGFITGVQVCANGAIEMTNTVTSPGPAGNPSKVLSGDERVFTATWKNTSATAVAALPVAYTYYVPYTRQSTAATWTCSVTGGGACPAGWDAGNSSISHDNPGEEADTVLSGHVDLAAGQTLTLTVTLATTINTCTQDGYLRVQSYATREKADSVDPSGKVRLSVPSQLVEIGCSTWMLNELFADAQVADPAWKGLDQACLTRATGAVTSNGVLGSCANRVRVPATNFNPGTTGLPEGYLKLTDDSGNRVGAALYDRAFPTKNGVVLEFTQYQYGDGGASHADGIGFFLSDGSYTLASPGSEGGALGYANRGTSENGLANGYLGVGFDVYGNYGDASTDITPQCTKGAGAARKLNAITLRGPGKKNVQGLWRDGYCAVGATAVLPSGQQLHHTTPTDLSNNQAMQSALSGAKRKTRVTVYPLSTGQTAPLVTIEMDFGQGYYTEVLRRTMTDTAPPLIKFGFLGSTGGSRDVHLISAVRVGTVVPMKELSMTKVVDYEHSTPLAEGKTGFSVGDTVAYKFVVHNATSAEASGVTKIFNVGIVDPLIPSISCPQPELDRFESMECTGTLTVQDSQRDIGRIVNTATVYGAVSPEPGAPRPLTDRSTAEVPVNPEAVDALRVIAPGGTATFQVIKHSSTLGIVRPDDPARLKLEVWNPAGSGAWVPAPSGSTPTSFTVSGQGTWAIDANNRVTFTPVNATYSGTVTPVKYRVTNAYGGWDEAELRVTISTVPQFVCEAPEQRQSQRNWAFGTSARIDFGTSGATPTSGTLPSLSGTHGTFTVTDAKGKLLFVVDSGTGVANSAVIRTATGTVMTGSGATIGNQLFGASPVTVIPAGQGTNKFIVITTSATVTSAGQLSWRLVDMTQNNGLGSAGAATPFGGTAASTAVTAVPNADGTGYWVLSPRRGNANIDAHLFSATGFTGTTVASAVGTNTAAATTHYEDIRYNVGRAASSGTAQFAVLTSANATSGTRANRVRLMSFNAATGALTVMTASQTFTRSDTTYGYSIEFSPQGNYLYASRIGSGNEAGVLYRAQVTANSLEAFASHVTAPSNNNGGAVRVGANGSLYWAQTGIATVRVKTDPNANTTTWANQSLATGSTSRFGLSNTLVDCAIPAGGFAVEKYASDGTTLTGGASFTLYPDEGGTAGGTPVSPGIQPVSGQTGRFTATGIAPGAYWLRETVAAIGHQLLVQDVLINVSLGGEIAVDVASNPQVKLVVSGSGSNKAYTIKVTNTKAPALPLAGGRWTLLLSVGGGTLLVAMLAGAWWWRRRRRDDIAGSS